MELGREEVNCDAGLRKCRSTRQKALAHQFPVLGRGLPLPASLSNQCGQGALRAGPVAKQLSAAEADHQGTDWW